MAIDIPVGDGISCVNCHENLSKLQGCEIAAEHLTKGLYAAQDALEIAKMDTARLKEAKALLERAMWMAAETDDEDFRDEIEFFLTNSGPVDALKKGLSFEKFEDPCGFGYE